MPLPVRYREEVYHPALTNPVITSGRFDAGKDGALIRRQIVPREETTEIGEKFATVSRENYKNTVLIPASLAPMLGLLRGMVGGNTPDLSVFEPRLDFEPSGWRVTLDLPESASMMVRGCGRFLDRVILTSKNNERRVIVFVRR